MRSEQSLFPSLLILCLNWICHNCGSGTTIAGKFMETEKKTQYTWFVCCVTQNGCRDVVMRRNVFVISKETTKPEAIFAFCCLSWFSVLNFFCLPPVWNSIVSSRMLGRTRKGVNVILCHLQNDESPRFQPFTCWHTSLQKTNFREVCSYFFVVEL